MNIILLETKIMAKCEVCGNNYDKSFRISIGDDHFDFDSFECAITKLAPTCAVCHCKVVGHGVENKGQIFCSHHCARRVANPT